MNGCATPIFDLAIVGGGINGCGIARDAAGRGASVFLCEMNDLGSGTSSWSTKLIHGGLRYLEYYEFRLVREALMEREVLMRMAPHLVRPIRLILPHHRGLRPAWLLRLGLFLYDHLGARRLLPGTKIVDLAHSPLGTPLRRSVFARGFEFSDCRVDDTRLVVLNAQDAAARGAVIAPRMRAVHARIEGSTWELTVQPAGSGEPRAIRARALINAAGPWVEKVLAGVTACAARAKVRLVQGSHIVVPRLYAHDRAYMFQNADGRIIFAIPYQDQYTLIGTTDRDYQGDPATVQATADEVVYLCRAASEYFEQPVQPQQVVWKFSGVRPLYDDGASEAKAATRDYVFEFEANSDRPPLLSIFGGKITTYRRLAEAAVRKLEPFLERLQGKSAWTSTRPLPGGDLPLAGLQCLAADLMADYSFLSHDLAARLAGTYGTRARQVLGTACAFDDLGRHFGADLSQAEVNYLMDHEWAREADDVLWRRSKLGLRLSPEEAQLLDVYMRSRSKAHEQLEQVGRS